MKIRINTICLLGLLALVGCPDISFGQQLAPLHVTKGKSRRYEPDSIKQLREGLTKEISTLQSVSSLTNVQASRLDSAEDKLDEINEGINQVDVAALVRKLNKGSNVYFSGVGGLSNLQSSQASGNFSLAGTFRLSDYHRMGESNWIDPAYVYAAFNTKTSSTEDSSDITKAILFPEISKRDFVAGFFWEFQHARKNLFIQPVVEFSLNRYNYNIDSTTTRTLRTESFTVGCKFAKTGTFSISGDTSFPSGIQIFPYYSLINIQPKNFLFYNQALYNIVEDVAYSLPPSWHCIGLQTTLQFSSIMLFCNMRYVLNQDSEQRPNNLRGFNYTIGTMVGIDFIKFRIGG